MLQVEPRRLSGLIETIYAASTGALGWAVLLEQFRQEFDHAYISLHGHDLTTQHNIGIIGSGYSAPYLASFRQHYAPLNPWSAQAARAPVGAALVSEALLPTEQLCRTEWYNDWVRPQEDIGTGVGITLMRDSRRIFRISCNIRLADRDRLQPRILDTLNALAPHLRRAFAIYQHARASAENRAEALNMFAGAALLIGADRRIYFFNVLAHGLMSGHSGAVASREGRLTLTDPRAQEWLERVLRQFAQRRLSAAGRALSLRASNGDTSHAIRIVPAPQMIAAVGRADYFDPGHALALVLVSPEVDQSAGNPLSRREADVLSNLAQGMANDRIAFALGIKSETVNLHIMSARRRLGARTREEAIAIAVRRNLI